MTGQQLKNSILQLAIQGKLVPQNPDDEPASELLKRIRAEKEKFIKEKKIKKEKPLPEISEDEKPFEIPDNWVWCRLGEIVYFIGGFAYKAPDLKEYGDFQVLRLGNVKNNGLRLDASPVYINKEIGETTIKYKAQLFDILVTLTGTRKKRDYFFSYLISSNDDCFHINQRVAIIRPKIKEIAHYLAHIIRAESILQDVFQYETGTANQGNLGINNISKVIIPLPPLQEQHRIVEKIEELMPLVDEYDKAQKELNTLNANLPEALKKSILQEAIQGKLGTNNPDDESASELLKRIRAEKEKLIKEKKIKKEKPLPEISDDEKPFEIPESWVWCRLGEVGIFERGNGIKRDETFSKGMPCVRYGEMYTKYRHFPTFDKTISFTSQEVFDKCRKAHKGDLFMALTGENKEDIALAAQYIGDEEIAVGGDLCHFTILQAYALYFVYLINSAYFGNKKQTLATGDIIVHISADKLGSIPIPLPPLQEQHRIVEKLNNILPKLKKL